MNALAKRPSEMRIKKGSGNGVKEEDRKNGKSFNARKYMI